MYDSRLGAVFYDNTPDGQFVARCVWIVPAPEYPEPDVSTVTVNEFTVTDST